MIHTQMKTILPYHTAVCLIAVLTLGCKKDDPKDYGNYHGYCTVSYDDIAVIRYVNGEFFTTSCNDTMCCTSAFTGQTIEMVVRPNDVDTLIVGSDTAFVLGSDLDVVVLRDGSTLLAHWNYDAGDTVPYPLTHSEEVPF